MWLDFRKKLKVFNVFSLRDIEKVFPGMNRMNLVRWQDKGYLLKIRNGWYCIAGENIEENVPWLAANLIYQPSYISLSTALSYYNLIPEGIYRCESVTTRKTNTFDTPIGRYKYYSVKASIYGFGHTLIASGRGNENSYRRKILFAELEKAILDFFYLNPKYNTMKEIENLRFDQGVLDGIDKAKFYDFLERFESKALNDRIFKMTKVFSL